MKKQEKLLYVWYAASALFEPRNGRKIPAQFSDAAAALCSFHVLLNLAEEPEIEKKMAKRGIVGYLCKMLARSNTELPPCSPDLPQEARDLQGESPRDAPREARRRLVGFVPHHTEAVLVSALRLLYNLSFDAHQRDAIIASPLLTKAVGLVRKRMQLPIVLRLAYNLSSTEKGRKALGATDLPAIVRKHVLACAELELPAELAALAINLACDKAGAEALSDGGALDQLVDRLLQTQDAMLMKLLRNLCAHDACGRQMLRRAGELFALTRQVDTPELLVELLGCLGALPVDELADVAQLVAGYELLDFAQRHMVPGFTDDDVLLEVIVLVGGLARNQTVATQIARTRLMAALYSLITEKQEDDEFVLQILYAFYQLLKADEPRVALLGQTQLVIYLLDLLLDKNAPIRKMASLCLDIVSENDEGWALQVNGAALLRSLYPLRSHPDPASLLLQIRQRKFQMPTKSGSR